ncbi:MAG: amino acid ABC transporter permease, partial [Selenomonas sp.]|nr:amino acid ABC transporter permease [Selenomonas sp.]
MDTRAFDFTVIGGIIGDLLAYLDVTLVVALTSIALGSLLGMALAGVKIAGSSWAKGLVNIYTYVMRCTPSIVLLFIVFYGLPVLVRGLFNYSINDMHRAVFAIITFALLFGAYISEVFRAAYQAVSRGQYEAAVSIGIKPWQAVWHVILPQAARIALPNFGNSVINLLKEGSLAYTIGL